MVKGVQITKTKRGGGNPTRARMPRVGRPGNHTPVIWPHTGLRVVGGEKVTKIRARPSIHPRTNIQNPALGDGTLL